MKKARAKALFQLASALPDTYVKRRIGQRFLGEELPPEHRKKIEPENFRSWYSLKKEQYVKVDHYRKLKDVYRKRKEDGLCDYIDWVENNNIKLNKLLSENEQLERVESGLLQVAKTGAKGFWSNLITFLYSFVAVFMGKKETA